MRCMSTMPQMKNQAWEIESLGMRLVSTLFIFEKRKKSPPPKKCIFFFFFNIYARIFFPKKHCPCLKLAPTTPFSWCSAPGPRRSRLQTPFPKTAPWVPLCRAGPSWPLASFSLISDASVETRAWAPRPPSRGLLAGKWGNRSNVRCQEH